MGEKKRKASLDDGKDKKRRKKSSSSSSSLSSSSSSSSSVGQKVKVEVVPFVSTDVKPLVIDFPNTPPPPSILSDSSSIQWHLFQDSKLTRKKYFKPILLRGESETMEWEGRCFQTKEKELKWGVDKKLKKEMSETEKDKEEKKKDPMGYEPLEGYFKTMVGIYSKKEGKVKIYEVAPCVHLYQHVKGFDTSSQQKEDALSFKQKQEQLVNLFGSKKKKLEQKRNSATDISGLKARDVKSAVQMDSILSQLAEDSGLNTTSETDASALLPPFDTKAVLAADIYPISSLLPDDLAETIDPKPLLKLSKSKTSLKKVKEENPPSIHSVGSLGQYYPSFALLCAEFGLKIGAGKEERNRLSRLILFGVYLVRIFGFSLARRKERGKASHTLCPTTDLDTLATTLDMPEHFLEKAVHMFAMKRMAFSPGHGRRMCYVVEDVLFHKITNYILIIALTLNDFEFGFEEAVSTLCLPRDTLRKNFTSIGCVSRKGKKAKSMGGEEEVSQIRYYLKAPLVIRTSLGGGRKK